MKTSAAIENFIDDLTCRGYDESEGGMIIHTDIIQGSDEWFAVRLGKVTASNMSCVLAKGRDGGKSKGRAGYMLRLAAERLTGCPQESYSNANMERGTETEDAARIHYEAIQGVTVEQVGFIELDGETVGISPDGLIGDDGMIEIKCPLTTTHIEYIMADKFPTTYKAQVQSQLWVAEREWCDFISFDPRMKSNKMFKVRVYRDPDYILDMSAKTKTFLEELKILVDTIGGSPF